MLPFNCGNSYRYATDSELRTGIRERKRQVRTGVIHPAIRWTLQAMTGDLPDLRRTPEKPLLPPIPGHGCRTPP